MGLWGCVCKNTVRKWLGLRSRTAVWRREVKGTKNCWSTNCKVWKHFKNSTKVYCLGQLSVVSHSNTLNPLWSIYTPLLCSCLLNFLQILFYFRICFDFGGTGLLSSRRSRFCLPDFSGPEACDANHRWRCTIPWAEIGNSVFYEPPI